MSKPTVIDRGESEFQKRPELEGHLAWESFIALAKHPNRILIVDRTLKRREMKSGLLLALAYSVSRKLKSWTDRKRVGIIFPPGIGAYIANLAVVLAGKVPVNLNFTLGRASAEACLKKAEIDCVLTTERVQKKLSDFPWPESGLIDIVEVLAGLSKLKTIALLAALKLFPAKLLATILKIPSVGGDVEAGLLFTSGSSGEPKGVVLTHRNVLGNCLQIDGSRLLPDGEKVIASLPVFHSFGFTVTLWYPILRGVSVVTLPSPLEFKKIAEAIAAESATVLISTPTFLRPYIRRIEPKKLKTLKYVVAGAEKTPEGFAELWQKTFASEYLEGYGLTETSPVVCANLPDKLIAKEGLNGSGTTGFRKGSVGRLFPGQAARILDPDSRESLPVTETGLLLLKGPNIFGGYLHDAERTAEVMQGDWFITGDLARFDEDGFLFIEGRLSRFSKIAGEMVPHGTVEQALMEAFDLMDSDVPMLAIGSRSDDAKGEVLVLLSAIDIELSDVKEKLSSLGFSNLWAPKVIKRVETIPTLATGKLDLRAIKELSKAD